MNEISTRRMNQNKKGFSLIEILVAVGIVSIVGFALTTLFISTQKQNKFIEQKLEKVELEQSIVKLLSDNSTCSCLLNGPAWSTGTTEINLASLKNGCSGNDLIQASQPINPNSQIRIDTIKIKDISDVGSGMISGVIEIKLKDTIQPMKPIVISGQSFITDNVATPTKITSCLGGSINSGNAIACGPNTTKTAGVVGSGNGFLVTGNKLVSGNWEESSEKICCYFIRDPAFGHCGYGAGGVCLMCHDMSNWGNVNP